MNRKVFIVFLMPVIIFTSGFMPMAKHTKQVNLAIPAGQSQFFTAKTHNGKITIKGCETTDCTLTTTITVKADTEEIAKNIAEQVQVALISRGNNIDVEITKPDIPKKVEVVVDLDVNLPAGMNLSLETHNGDIKASNMLGSADLSTHNGKIDYTGTLSDLGFETHNGDVDIHCTGQSEKVCKINAKTHNGSIEFTAPENFSAAIDISTHNGSIHSSLPITITEKTDEKLEGVISDGRDKLHIETHNGSIKIK